MRLIVLLFALILAPEMLGTPIYTPEYDERNDLVIKAPQGWGYRTFKGENGLIGALWPKGTSFNSADTAVFVFAQHYDQIMPKIPENAYLFTEKCPLSKFKFADPRDEEDRTLSIEERYFSGRCGKTRVLFEEKVDDIRIIVILVSSYDVAAELFKDVKYIVSAYKKEAEAMSKRSKGSETEEQSNEETGEQQYNSRDHSQRRRTTNI
ncbi:MAG: hypothetical protein IJA14_05315 [Alphaproteobacteria bacterium]|nr:hypothetical protein [Alphaproteobacteria bacterium]